MKNDRIWYRMAITLLLFTIYMMIRWQVIGEIPFPETFLIGFGFGSLVLNILGLIN